MKKDNKGFSLVELIIVIAIMAILVGIVGSQVLPYLNKSREAKDQQILSGWVTAALSAYSSNAADLTSDTYKLKINTPSGVAAAAADASAGSPNKPEVLVNAFNELSKCDGVSFSSTLYKTIDYVEITVTPKGNDDGLVVIISDLNGIDTTKGSISTSELVAK